MAALVYVKLHQMLSTMFLITDLLNWDSAWDSKGGNKLALVR